VLISLPLLFRGANRKYADILFHLIFINLKIYPTNTQFKGTASQDMYNPFWHSLINQCTKYIGIDLKILPAFSQSFFLGENLTKVTSVSSVYRINPAEQKYSYVDPGGYRTILK
jgi:hypothetical protein